jgi:hypothetical protein
MTQLWKLFSAQPWWELVPDLDHVVLTGKLGSGHERAVLAITTDKRSAIVYIPTRRDVTIDLGQFAGLAVAATWYDPTNGSFQAVKGSPFKATGSYTFSPAGKNAERDTDWVLLLQSSE